MLLALKKGLIMLVLEIPDTVYVLVFASTVAGFRICESSMGFYRDATTHGTVSWFLHEISFLFFYGPFLACTTQNRYYYS